ncbi:MAG: endopeptidase La [Bacteroidetes bacterium]|jgi:ATP-dependent Lon protease|nr:endopeptidase La [Bacteroidota bacterium]MBT4400591.1 endopeptidase La [Bacteroidota bacterium]MBT4411234.1 endopeptidase La [Bacteroidota bacterium]MBT7091880.1 endopeptidase La [Bacteroidota bacterium]MBT7465327.1 endopeptidase La [Bacteroidota bacterium]
MDFGDDDSDFIPLLSDGKDEDINSTEIPDNLPILPLRNTVLFPGVVIPITVGREKSIKLIKDLYKGNKQIGVIAQKDTVIDDPGIDDLYSVGTVASIVKILNMPDDSTSVIIQGKRRFHLDELLSDDPYLLGKVTALEDVKPIDKQEDFDAVIGSVKDIALKIVQFSSNIPQEASFALKNIEGASFLVNYICSNLDIDADQKQRLLEMDNLKERGVRLLEYLSLEYQKQKLKRDIQDKVKLELDQQQKEYLLNQQMKTIQDELGGNPMDQEIQEIKNKAKKKDWSEEVAKVFEKELDKLSRINPSSAEYSVQLNYLDIILDLPWNVVTEDNFDLKRAQKILDEDHSGLDQVKDRILEHLAVLKLKGDMKSPIICLYGPPGVGKTSLGKSVARAIDRNYVRMSLGGLKDESEIRGHRKTYIGAMPGRIVQYIKRAQSSNPVFILDEIDKVGSDFRGDPASALLEVLDPEQNSAFYDNFLEMEYDLSKVLFIATANNPATIHPALRDRMEMIEISGYVVEEKIEIAHKHLVEKQLEAHGLKKGHVKFSNEVLSHIIENYTRESGVRQLDKKIAKVVRQIAKSVAFAEKVEKKLSLEGIRKFLGPPEVLREKYQGNEYAGVVTGLAWTETGGQILYVESSLSRGKGNLTLTGNLGEVMKESAMLALEYIKSHADYFNIPADIFEKWNVHIHVPEGAIPKDGPSAGVTMVSSLVSSFTQRKIKSQLAMTGEITLRGRVLPVGGIKEKILAAKRASIKEVLLAEENRKDVEQIKPKYLKGLRIQYVSSIKEVLDNALLKQKVKDAIKID